ncbi:Cation transport protein [Lentzea xinjiangensis]|uniref:Cation transport protein n=1 Tax=Lentzea xinjiangensis TaxID=402600 RepID=A0A1H9W971_9PSEU|nr:Cation transport protein [Lentzea xinjiangensis]
MFAFAAATLVGTMLLMLPVAAESGSSTGAVPALFTAVSALCATGLVVVDTPTHWSTFGEVVVLALIQVGGFGVMTLASLLTLLVSRRLGLRMQLTAQTETKALGLGDVRTAVGGVIVVSLAAEAVTAVVLTSRFMIGYHEPPGRAIYLGVFHAVSAFNTRDSRSTPTAWSASPWTRGSACRSSSRWSSVGWAFRSSSSSCAAATGIGGRCTRGSRVPVYFGLLLVDTLAFVLSEWRNTLGGLDFGNKLLAGLFHGVMPRTAGFNSVDVGAMHSSTLLINDVLMFIGGGSAGTSGGIKVTTFALLAFVILAEIRGEPTVHVMGRRISPRLSHPNRVRTTL